MLKLLRWLWTVVCRYLLLAVITRDMKNQEVVTEVAD